MSIENLIEYFKWLGESLADINDKRIPKDVLEVVTIVSNFTSGKLATQSNLKESFESVNKFLKENGSSLLAAHMSYDFSDRGLKYSVIINEIKRVDVKDFGVSLCIKTGKISRNIEFSIIG